LVKNEPELVAAINWAGLKKLPVLFLAGGSNVLITKGKIRGLVIKITGQSYSVEGGSISAWAGIKLSKLAEITYDLGLTGLEWAWGVPGTLGGAVRGNAGAYGSDISGQVAEVKAYDASKGELIKLSKPACGFSYRHSIFKKKRNLFILNVKLKLNQADKAEVKDAAAKNLHSRRQTNPTEPSAGCVFKNLVYDKLIKENRELAQAIEAKGLFRGGKIGAAYLIDQLGLKGKTMGGAKISEKHANFIVNTGEAKAKDVIKLINLVKRKVKNQYKINLEEEIEYFGL
jgi:UDP-N-acetylmuramate dehydrogenase